MKSSIKVIKTSETWVSIFYNNRFMLTAEIWDLPIELRKIIKAK